MEIDTRNTNIERMQHFPNSHNQIFSHTDDVSELLPDFTEWLESEDTIIDNGDQFKCHKQPTSKRKRHDKEDEIDVEKDK